MAQNLAWGAGYNLVAIPLGRGCARLAGITLSPPVGAILVSASTVVVAFNGQLLRRLDIRPTRAPTSDAAPEAARSGAGRCLSASTGCASMGTWACVARPEGATGEEF